jgi:hypothetical protein
MSFWPVRPRWLRASLSRGRSDRPLLAALPPASLLRFHTSVSLRLSLLPQVARFARRRPCRCLRPALPLRADALRAGGRGTAGSQRDDAHDR